MKNNPNSYRIIIPGLLGNILEWYDFALYGYFASVISPLFFPTNHPRLSLILTFAVFAMGFIMRPLGAIIFGHFGDLYGRKNALAAAILLMALPTTFIGLLPSYQQIGLIAPLALIVLRLLQGLAVGGEFTGSIVYILEHTPKNKRGVMGSIVMSSAFIGLFMGSAIATGLGYIIAEHEELFWIWRIAFIISLALGGIGLYLRMNMPESPVFETIKDKSYEIPIIRVIKNHKASLIFAFMLVMLPSASFYLYFVYLVTHLNSVLGIDNHHALLTNSLTMLILIVSLPLFGVLGDKLGKTIMLLIGAIMSIIIPIPLFIALEYKSLEIVLAVQCTFAVLISLSYSCIPAILVELFTPSIRLTGMSLPYNLANACFGGTAPLVATSLIHYTNNNLSPAVYISFLALMSMVFIWRIQENERKNLAIKRITPHSYESD